ncbi:probable carboxylesterase 12 [Diospyros lotus]|uniref:probable carboxylesterase 12 n=1 Tax=Diospyros lotus TaxID=55363 RepID=UPI0022552E9D|nr:probable carboxylesterase 12 [Diospyros lotus]
MDVTSSELVFDFPFFIRAYKDGRIERLIGTDVVPPSTNPVTGVQSKDVVLVPETGLSVRLYLPKTAADPGHKLPLLLYFHGGGFCIETASSPTYHNYLNSLVDEAKVVVVSVDYRRAPEYPLPVAYDDSWAAVKWAASHSAGGGPEMWLNDYVDFDRVFFAGDSAGGNIAHNMALRIGSEGINGIKVVGMVLIHPFFWGKDPIGVPDQGDGGAPPSGLADKLWMFVCPTSSGSDDPLINPVKDPKFGSLGCVKVLVCVAEKDSLRDRGRYYCEELGKSGWRGTAEIMEAAGENHVFHLFSPATDNAVAMLKRVASFINDEGNS